MQERPERRPPGLVVDTSLSHTGEALALAVLYGMEGKEECRIAAVNVTRTNLKAAAYCEVIGRFYAGAVSGAFAAFRRPLPIGMNDSGILPDDAALFTVPLEKRNAEGKPVYTHDIHRPVDTAESPALIRNALTAQQDQNSVVVLLGPATSLASTLELPGFKEWVKRKVKFLCVNQSRFNTQADPAAEKKLMAEWPGRIVIAGEDLDLTYPGASIEKDFSWNENHPVADAYRAGGKMPYDAPAQAMAAMLYAGRPEQNYFTVSGPEASGHFRLSATVEQKTRIAQSLIELASAKPVVRERRRRT
jgi:hypothetical protein